MRSSGLLTDQYELTMVRAALGSGVAERRSVFEVFARKLPPGRRYGVVAGAARLISALSTFTFGRDELGFLRTAGVVDDRTAGYLESYRFTGSIWGYGEGECYFPGSPILVVESTFAQAVLLETLVLSVLNHDCAIASAASRMVSAAGGRPIIEMGGRRTHELAAVAAARAAYIAGVSSTSNLRAGRDYGVPTAGTAAHAFTMVHDDERGAFAAQLEALGHGTTLLVDTFDVDTAVRTAIDLAGPDLGAIRIDSGDLAAQAGRIRAMLDSLGATRTKIVLTGDLDEYAIAGLADAPADAYGVGTSLVTGSGAPTAGLVYKLVARAASPAGPLVPVAKRSVGKSSRGGRKWAARELDATGTAIAELISADPIPAAPDSPGWPDSPHWPSARPLLREFVRDGEVVADESLNAARERHRRAVAELPAGALALGQGEPCVPTVFTPRDHPGE
jgi:nicotinate phosphoribosyltransferase